MQFWLYNLGWLFLRPMIPWLLARRTASGKEAKSRIAERYGDAGAAPLTPGMIWLHAVSVGETVAALGLVEALAARQPAAYFLITTNTVTAASMVEAAAGRMQQNRLHHRFQPLDHPAFVDRFLTTYRPALAIFLESDFWPNLITRSAQRGIPVVFASSQMSDTAFARWQRRLCKFHERQVCGQLQSACWPEGLLIYLRPDCVYQRQSGQQSEQR